MSLAYEAMVFARGVHAKQKRKYTGNLRTTSSDLIDAMIEMYESGLPVHMIALESGIGAPAICSYVANHSLKRIQSKFSDGVACFAFNGENFLPIQKFESYYVSTFGRILGMTYAKPGTILKPYVCKKSGYHSVKIIKNGGVAVSQYLHTLVLTAFIGERPPGMQGAHGDGNKSNNYMHNLRWATPVENAADKVRHGTALLGINHPNAKITADTASEIKRLLGHGLTHQKIASQLSTSIAAVANIAQNKTWKHVADPRLLAMARAQVTA